MRSRTWSVFVLVSAFSLAATMAVFGQDLQRTAQAGGVMGAAAPVNLARTQDATIDFTVALNTHSFPLAFDMTEIALLSDGEQTEHALRWTGGRGGHHLMGTLSFPAGVLRKADRIVLTLKGAGGGGDLSFEWKKPF